ncbi:MAG: rhodanese-like domain-containing protein, partial [Burkholderiales bacterium]|nr:rhodanese-like domain-containing protein [Burkholderiales bacterium]
LVLTCLLSATAFFFLPIFRRRFSPANGLNTLEATRLMNAGGTMIIDVREEAEFAGGHLTRAVNIPLSQLEERLPDIQKKSSKNILVYCERGHRSARAAKILAKSNKTIHNLSGGIVAWKEANLPVEKSAASNAGAGSPKKNGNPPSLPSKES